VLPLPPLQLVGPTFESPQVESWSENLLGGLTIEALSRKVLGPVHDQKERTMMERLL
jgi:hypothetical protein